MAARPDKSVHSVLVGQPEGHPVPSPLPRTGSAVRHPAGPDWVQQTLVRLWCCRTPHIFKFLIPDYRFLEVEVVDLEVSCLVFGPGGRNRRT